jgi:hypothetical protein
MNRVVSDRYGPAQMSRMAIDPQRGKENVR